jgi:hypothetical protein
MLALIGAACEPEKPNPGEEIYTKYPRRPATDPVTTPTDSILPPYIEKWIWVRYSTDDCVPITETFSPPEDFFGPDAHAITIDWRDSTYTSQHSRNLAGGYTNYNISGTFSCRDTIIMYGNPVLETIFTFRNGIAMHPPIKEWIKYPDYYVFSDWRPAYIAQYQVPEQFVALYTTEFKGQHHAQLYFLRITSENWVQHYEPVNKNQSITFNQNQNKNQLNYKPFKN